MSKKEIRELEKALTSFGGGYGDPEAKWRDEKRLELLVQKESKKWDMIKFWISIFFSTAALVISLIALMKE